MSAVKSPVLSPRKKTGQKEGSESLRASVGTKKRKTEAPAVVPTQSKLQVKLLSEHGVVPTRGSKQAAGYDLSSAHDVTIQPRGRSLIKTDIAVALPEGTYGRIAPRSGLAADKGIATGAGVVDADYRGPINIILFNHSDEAFEVKKGDRIAQMVIEVIKTPEVEVVESLEDTERGEAGFGSTGTGTHPSENVDNGAKLDEPSKE